MPTFRSDKEVALYGVYLFSMFCLFLIGVSADVGRDTRLLVPILFFNLFLCCVSILAESVRTLLFLVPLTALILLVIIFSFF